LAIVDLPAPDIPVNHKIAGGCFFSELREFLLTSIACHGTLRGFSSPLRISPAAIVSFVTRSIRMNPPVSRFCS
jgi:hypothetical protein